MNTKQFLLFAGPTYYPSGGWDDFVASADSIDSLKKSFAVILAKDEWFAPWAHIVDITDGLQVCHWHLDRKVPQRSEWRDGAKT